MESPLDFYSKIQSLVKNEARKAAEEVYAEKGTQFDVATVPVHIHNGVDAPSLDESSIIPGTKLITGLFSDTSETVTLWGLFNPKRISVFGFAANNAITSATLDGNLPIGNVSFTGGFAGGETSGTLTSSWTGSTGLYQATFSSSEVRHLTFTHGSTHVTFDIALGSAATATVHVDGAIEATLSSAWAGDSADHPVTFSNGNTREVVFTNGSTDILWNGILTGSTASDTITIGASKKAVISGEIQFGNCLYATDLTPPFVLTTNGPGVPYGQICNAMYIDIYSATQATVDISDAGFMYATDKTGATAAYASVISYNNQLGNIQIEIQLGTGWTLQTNMIIS